MGRLLHSLIVLLTPIISGFATGCFGTCETWDSRVDIHMTEHLFEEIETDHFNSPVPKVTIRTVYEDIIKDTTYHERFAWTEDGLLSKEWNHSLGIGGNYHDGVVYDSDIRLMFGITWPDGMVMDQNYTKLIEVDRNENVVELWDYWEVGLDWRGLFPDCK
jgi:hypothetical protein